MIGEVDDAYIKVAKIKGVLAWHSHDDEDELFYVLRGALRIELEDGAVELGEGQMWVVPKGVRHNSVAENECLVLLIERKSTLHTGDIVTEKTRTIAEQLRAMPEAAATAAKDCVIQMKTELTLPSTFVSHSGRVIPRPLNAKAIHASNDRFRAAGFVTRMTCVGR